MSRSDAPSADDTQPSRSSASNSARFVVGSPSRSDETMCEAASIVARMAICSV